MCREGIKTTNYVDNNCLRLPFPNPVVAAIAAVTAAAVVPVCSLFSPNKE